MRTLLIVLLIGLGIQGEKLFAQADTFIVKTPKSLVTVSPNDSWFYLREDYTVKIKYSGKNKMSRVELKGGTVSQKDSLYTLNAVTGGEAVLIVYEKMKDGKERVALSKTYKLFGRELPLVSIDGVPNDSVIDKFTLIALGKLRAKTKYSQQVYRVDSFTLYMRNGAKFDTLKSKTNQLTPEMKQRIDKIDVKKSGGMLTFEDIHATSPEGKDVLIPPLRVFLSEESRIKFGL